MRVLSLGMPALVLIGLGAGLLGGNFYMRTKGRLAAQLIDRAWDAYLTDGAAHEPWPWADFHPIARLGVPRLGVERIVLSGASGTSLAFGPGHLDGTVSPGTVGNTLIAGHRDSWFRFLGDLRRGDELHLSTRAGTTCFVVHAIRIVDEAETWIADPDLWDGLTLLTCHPIGGIVPTDRRLVVFGARCAFDAP